MDHGSFSCLPSGLPLTNTPNSPPIFDIVLNFHCCITHLLCYLVPKTEAGVVVPIVAAVESGGCGKVLDVAPVDEGWPLKRSIGFVFWIGADAFWISGGDCIAFVPGWVYTVDWAWYRGGEERFMLENAAFMSAK
jgi:hypothetical protein